MESFSLETLIYHDYAQPSLGKMTWQADYWTNSKTLFRHLSPSANGDTYFNLLIIFYWNYHITYIIFFSVWSRLMTMMNLVNVHLCSFARLKPGAELLLQSDWQLCARATAPPPDDCDTGAETPEPNTHTHTHTPNFSMQHLEMTDRQTGWSETRYRSRCSNLKELV